jgi:hypothetical protein
MHLGFPRALFLSGFPAKIQRFLTSLMRTTCLAHLILLYLITRTIYDNQKINRLDMLAITFVEYHF